MQTAPHQYPQCNGSEPPRFKFVRLITFALLSVAILGCELGWQTDGGPSDAEAAALSAAGAVGLWVADNSGCSVQALEVEYEGEIGTLDDASGRIANQTPMLNGSNECDNILLPSDVQTQDAYPTGSRSGYRSLIETRIDESPTEANHLVTINWVVEEGSFSSLIAVNSDSLQLLFAPMGSLAGSNAASEATSAERIDTLGTGSSGEATWRPAGEDGENLVWQSPTTTEIRGEERIVNMRTVLASIAPEKTVEWNQDAAFTSGNCTIGNQGLVSSASVDPAVNTIEGYRHLAETDVRATWQDGQCCVECVVDVGIGTGAVTLSSSADADGFGSTISKVGVGQFWTFQRDYSWCLRE